MFQCGEGEMMNMWLIYIFFLSTRWLCRGRRRREPYKDSGDELVTQMWVSKIKPFLLRDGDEGTWAKAKKKRSTKYKGNCLSVILLNLNVFVYPFPSDFLLFVLIWRGQSEYKVRYRSLAETLDLPFFLPQVKEWQEINRALSGKRERR